MKKYTMKNKIYSYPNIVWLEKGKPALDEKTKMVKTAGASIVINANACISRDYNLCLDEYTAIVDNDILDTQPSMMSTETKGYKSDPIYKYIPMFTFIQ